MAEKEQTLQSVSDYYLAAEKGYWGHLGGRCHYGFTPEGHKGPFNMQKAQIDMEVKLGETLSLPSGSRVLDAGCGWSPVARTLTEQFGFEVTGVDFLKRRLDAGQHLNRGCGLDTIGLVNADYHHLPFEDNSFDGVYTMETIVHAYSLSTVLGEFRRVLRPGGRVVLLEYSIPDLKSIPRIPRLLAERVIKNTGMASLPQMIHGKWPDILKSAGFENARATDISKNVYPSWFHLWKFSIQNILEELSKGHIGLDIIPGSFWIWPAKTKLGYNICEASKPAILS